MSTSALWWERDRLHYDSSGNLCLAGRPVGQLAAAAAATEKPLFLYDGARVEQNILRLGAALTAAGVRHRLFYAMKSNRFVPLLTMMKLRHLCGIDACSPAEIVQARQCGFEANEIAFTATSVSDADWNAVRRHRDIVIHCDSLSSIRRLAALGYRGTIGIRVNPGTGIGYGSNERLRYAGAESPTKFGIYRDAFTDALALARAAGLTVNGLHFHAGCGFLTPQLPQLERVFDEARWFLDQIPDCQYVDIGGGLGIPLVAEDAPLDLHRWAALVAQCFGTGIEVWVEPGDYFVKDAGVLVLQVNTVEAKAGHTFLGVNGGFNIHIEPAFYDLPLEIVPVTLAHTSDRAVLASRSGQKVTVAGNINEALDVFAENLPLPTIQEGDSLALLNSGGYGSSMSSNHCMRGDFLEQLII